jgi:hypothetical protein
MNTQVNLLIRRRPQAYKHAQNVPFQRVTERVGVGSGSYMADAAHCGAVSSDHPSVRVRTQT